MTVDIERVAEILVDAFTLGDGSAARKWRTSTRTIRRYRARLRTEPELAAIVREKREDAEEELSALRVRFLRKALGVLEKKIEAENATVYEIAGAVKIVGELHQVAEAIGDDGSDVEDPGAAQDAGDGIEAANGPH